MFFDPSRDIVLREASIVQKSSDYIPVVANFIAVAIRLRPRPSVLVNDKLESMAMLVWILVHPVVGVAYRTWVLPRSCMQEVLGTKMVEVWESSG